ncbi:LysR family transcriptional regulator [Phyllobacterium sp. SB3]|uniref:LysR family transcriptional regulator n=1 Tax=Phyllobacterium sp. SB3 TaxID=3156073 RepID=UPI0032AF0589
MKRMTILQLEAFFWTAELGSVQKAADHLSVTQPTLSLRLRQLENVLAAPVLERHGRGVRLTREGHTFLSHVKTVLDAYGELQKSSHAPEISGVVRIGLAEGLAVACLPYLIEALEKDFPLLRPEWTVGTSAGLEQSLADGSLDLAALVDPIGLRDVRFFALGLQPNVWAIPATMVGKTGETPHDLTHLTIITTPPPTAMYRLTMGWFGDGYQQPGALCVCSSLNAALQLVGSGIGIGIFPAKMIEAYPLAETIAILVPRPPIADGRVFIADRTTSDAAKTTALIRIFERVTRSLKYFAT